MATAAMGSRKTQLSPLAGVINGRWASMLFDVVVPNLRLEATDGYGTHH